MIACPGRRRCHVSVLGQRTETLRLEDLVGFKTAPGEQILPVRQIAGRRWLMVAAAVTHREPPEGYTPQCRPPQSCSRQSAHHDSFDGVSTRAGLARPNGSSSSVGWGRRRRQGDGPTEEEAMESISLHDARRVIGAAEAKAQEIGQPMDIAVVDDGGHLRAHVRMDGALIARFRRRADRCVSRRDSAHPGRTDRRGDWREQWHGRAGSGGR